MISILKSIATIIGALRAFIPALFSMIKNMRRKRDKRLDAEAIRLAKGAKTNEDRKKSAKGLFDRTNS